MKSRFSVPAALVLVLVLIVATALWVSRGVTWEPRETPFDRVIKENLRARVEQGRQIFVCEGGECDLLAVRNHFVSRPSTRL